MFDNFVKQMAIRDTGTERLIKDTAKRIFFAEGKLHATTQDIADAAGINKALLHYYFRSKEKLFEMIFTEVMRDFLPRINELFESDKTVIEKIEVFCAAYIDKIKITSYNKFFYYF